MKISSTGKKTAFFKIVAVVLLVIAAVGTSFQLYTSAMLPQKYIFAVVALWIVAVALVSFLLFKHFSRFGKLARATGVVVIAVLLAASVFGVYLLQNTLSALNEVSKEGSVTIQTDKPFYVFISGIDSYGDIEAISRSDVNILAAVNPNTKTITLITVPRDSYVPIALGGNDKYDKLTHAGIYGVESSMKTVGNLFDVDIEGYVRINFTSFIKGIDRLGGITVNNPRAFSSFGEHFPAGNIYLTGERALVYSRERMNLPAGDIDRGLNQQRVISAIVAKISSVRSLDGFQGLLEIGKDSVQTNLSSNTVRKLINQQVNSPAQWQTKTIELKGRGETGTRTSAAMPNAKLYMYILNEKSVKSAKEQLHSDMATN